MPKRKREEGYEKLLKKMKKLEKKLRRRCRSGSQSSSHSETSEQLYRSGHHELEHAANSSEAGEAADMLDGRSTPESQSRSGPNAVEAGEPPAGLPSEPTATTGNSEAQTSSNATIALNTTQAISGEDTEPIDLILDSTILEILGDDPTITNNYGAEIHKDLAVRLEHIATHGLSKEVRKELNEKYLPPSNCTLINAPALNAEIKAAISEMVAKRDKNIEFRQKHIATAISCLSQVTNKLFSCKDVDAGLIKMVMDAERLLCDSQHNDSTIRRNYILSSLKKDMKDQLQNTKPDTLLFGQNLTETLKAAKAISKSGAELKVPAPRPQQTANKKLPAPNTSKNLNWKGPYPPRKQPDPPKTKNPPPSKNRQHNSSRHYQQQPTRGRR